MTHVHAIHAADLLHLYENSTQTFPYGDSDCDSFVCRFLFSHFSGEGHYNLLYNIRGVGLKNVYIVLRRLGGWSKKYDFFVL